MIKIENLSDCCGCSACANICNHGAITMQPDALGFLYPVVDIEKCTNCGLCENVCSFNDNYDTSYNYTFPIAYGARHQSMDEVMKSRSGAVFAALSDYVIEQGGVIYGAGYVDHFKVAHKRATTTVERDEFRGSKYVQSDMNTVYRHVKADLKNGLLVLFSGTPCQTSALCSYVGRKYRERLILVDLICHGVPGPFLWRDYINYLEKLHGSEIVWVNFRDKEVFGWKAHAESYKFLNENTKSFFNYVFYNNIMLRESCENCYYCNLKRPSDITIGDYWGWERSGTTLNCDDRGLNIVLINTAKGKQVFDLVKSSLFYFKAEIDSFMQPNLQSPTCAHPKKRQFEQDYIKKGFSYVINHDYDKTPFLTLLQWRIITLLKNLFKR